MKAIPLSSAINNIDVTREPIMIRKSQPDEFLRDGIARMSRTCVKRRAGASFGKFIIDGSENEPLQRHWILQKSPPAALSDYLMSGHYALGFR